MSTIEIHKNSITNLHTDVVVNAANSSLAEGGGVCGVIFAAAGSAKLTAACRAIGGCPTGSAVITPAFDMTNQKYIIHAVGPRYRDGKHGEPEDLYSCYKKALELARDNQCASVGFPLISAGIFGYPEKDAWERALAACLDFIGENPDYDIDIVFVRMKRTEADTGKAILEKIKTARES